MKTFVDQYGQREDGKIGIVEVSHTRFSESFSKRASSVVASSSHTAWPGSSERGLRLPQGQNQLRSEGGLRLCQSESLSLAPEKLRPRATNRLGADRPSPQRPGKRPRCVSSCNTVGFSVTLENEVFALPVTMTWPKATSWF